ncbi:ribosome biogenesis GTP-binding protein YihA/YsxC [Thermocrinis minervae]|uniref:Probable GTP-binding protein EngB n=1 Tax=Thermocrinis minervae TaxID=381751 RepID=A0A1M6QP21_9AQUI|nr:ribosome biogenesis GTP-binding protein YihA/YsxC [Thermocrinis minervae]SHK22039.1 GTP-binding protein [Thermocrinis minervae]
MRDLPTDLPHVVFVGRSNVGKSSLINMIFGRNVARVSKEPGRTRNIYLYPFEEKIYVVDVPGYGYAKVSRSMLQEWKKMMEEYFKRYKEIIKIVFVLVDCVVGLTELDLQMLEYLNHMGIKRMIILTKCDKASQKELSRVKFELQRIGVEYVVTSAKEGIGKKEIIKLML